MLLSSNKSLHKKNRCIKLHPPKLTSFYLISSKISDWVFIPFLSFSFKIISYSKEFSLLKSIVKPLPSLLHILPFSSNNQKLNAVIPYSLTFSSIVYFSVIVRIAQSANLPSPPSLYSQVDIYV